MIKAISYIFKRTDLSNQEFVNHYETTHAPLAKSILEFGYYERNHILNNDSNKLPSCISIFKYDSEEQLKKTQKTLENYPPDLKEDELKFMDFDKNYYYFVEEDVINDKTYMTIKIIKFNSNIFVKIINFFSLLMNTFN